MRNAFRKKAVAILAVLGVAFGCALMTFLFSIAAGMEQRMERMFNELSGRIAITNREGVFGGLLMGLGNSSAIPFAYEDIVKGVPHVKNVSDQISIILRPKGVSFIMPLFGYGSGGGGSPFTKLLEGHAPVNANEVVIGKSLQEYMRLLDVNYAVGDVYPFEVSEKASSDRIMELKIVGVYQTGNEVLDGGFSSLEKLARDVGKIPPGSVSVINAQVDSLDNVESAAQEIERRLAGKKPEVQVSVPRQILIPLVNVLRLLDSFFLAISLVAVAAGGLMILVVMLLSVIERRREFGILKALGWTPRDIVCMVLVESFFLSLLGAALWVTLGYAALVAAKGYVGIDLGLFSGQVRAGGGASGVRVGGLGGLYPAWRANRTAPAEILRGV
jgi:putative ABC transport system permease protein